MKRIFLLLPLLLGSFIMVHAQMAEGKKDRRKEARN